VEVFGRSLRRNLASSYGVIQALLPALRASGSGRIVAVSSVTGGTMAMRHEVSYAGSQAGLEGMVRALAVDEAENGMTVNAVAPG
jgi:3-oxoacyl-[acyl-carrier protein] reductase